MNRLYMSHFLSAWGDRMWEFAVGLLLIHVWPDTLATGAAYGMVLAVVQVLGGAPIGDWVDRSERIAVVRRSLVVANGSVAASALVISMLLSKVELAASDHKALCEGGGVGTGGGAAAHPERDFGFWLLLLLIMAGGVFSTLGSLASTLAVEKDWVKVVCRGNPELLANTNAVMRRIDLFCKVAAPVLAGMLMENAGARATAVILAVWNCVSLLPEYLMLTWVYESFPELADKDAADCTTGPKTLWALALKPMVTLKVGWQTYAEQKAFQPALSLALLYCTSLSFGIVTTQYVNSRGLGESLLSVFRSIGATFGLMSTFIYPQLQKSKGVVMTGGIAIWLQLSLLGLCLLSTAWSEPGDCRPGGCGRLQEIYVDGLNSGDICERSRNVELGLLLTGIITSRLGLWMFDLSVSQMLQEEVDDSVLGIVNGTQNSMQTLLDLLGYLLAFLLSNKENAWPWLVYTSIAFVFGAVAVYTRFWVQDGLGTANLTRGGPADPESHVAPLMEAFAVADDGCGGDVLGDAGTVTEDHGAVRAA